MSTNHQEGQVIEPETFGNQKATPLPHNLEVEQALLGAILANNDALNRVSFLEPHNFYDPLHQRIYETLRTLIERGQLAIPATLKTYMDADEGLQVVGGAQYLARLSAAATSAAHAED